MLKKDEALELVTPEAEASAAQRARDKARTARWDLDIAVFLFAILIIVIILLFQGIGVEWVSPIALFGLVMVWLVGWRRGKQLYQRFYEDEISQIRRAKNKTLDETVEEKVQKALRERNR